MRPVLKFLFINAIYFWEYRFAYKSFQPAISNKYFLFFFNVYRTSHLASGNLKCKFHFVEICFVKSRKSGFFVLVGVYVYCWREKYWIVASHYIYLSKIYLYFAMYIFMQYLYLVIYIFWIFTLCNVMKTSQYKNRKL